HHGAPFPLTCRARITFPEPLASLTFRHSTTLSLANCRSVAARRRRTNRLWPSTTDRDILATKQSNRASAAPVGPLPSGNDAVVEKSSGGGLRGCVRRREA